LKYIQMHRWLYGFFYAVVVMTHTIPLKSQVQYPFQRHIQKKIKKRAVTLIAVGDLMVGGSALPLLRRKGPDYPFDSTRSILKMADVAVANLEAPFTSRGIAFHKKYTFCVPPAYASSLFKVGFDVCLLANNHILDYGPDGLFETVQILDSLDIKHCGAGKNLKDAGMGCIVEQSGWRFGFLAYSLTYPSEFWASQESFGTVYPGSDNLKERIRDLKKKADIIVVSFHWGGELMRFPKTYQRMYAHNCVDYGADLVIGHHPHVLQGLEIYRNKLIAYSLGNFVFGSYTQNVKESMLLKVWFDDRGIVLAEVIPIDVNNYRVGFQPRILRKEKKRRVFQELNDISKRYNQGKLIVRDSGLVVVDPY
jgi:poly-gamma-glutamate capsule biosynthesis protein CapA/YwtB (metallophosphatase superfamily)